MEDQREFMFHEFEFNWEFIKFTDTVMNRSVWFYLSVSSGLLAALSYVRQLGLSDDLHSFFQYLIPSVFFGAFAIGICVQLFCAFMRLYRVQAYEKMAAIRSLFIGDLVAEKLLERRLFKQRPSIFRWGGGDSVRIMMISIMNALLAASGAALSANDVSCLLLILVGLVGLMAGPACYFGTLHHIAKKAAGPPRKKCSKHIS